MIKRSKRYSYLFELVLIVVVLCSCLLFSTIAWLQQTYDLDNKDNQIGRVEAGIYHNGVKVEGTTSTVDGKEVWECNTPYEIAGGNTQRTLNLKVRNEGTIDALMRVRLIVYYMEGNNKCPLIISDNTPTISGTVQLDITGFILDFKGGVACGNIYFNSKFEPYTTRTLDADGQVVSTTDASKEVSIINQLIVAESQKDVTLYADVSVDLVAYSGNIYKKIENNQTSIADIPVSAYPFGTKETLPESWTAWR